MIYPHRMFKILLNKSNDAISFPLSEVSKPLAQLLNKLKVGATTTGEEIINGTSWEMACVMSLFGINGSFSGSVGAISEHGRHLKIEFEKVKGLKIKKKLNKNIYTVNEIPYVLVPL